MTTRAEEEQGTCTDTALTSFIRVNIFLLSAFAKVVSLLFATRSHTTHTDSVVIEANTLASSLNEVDLTRRAV